MASVTAIDTGSAPRPLPSAGSHHPGFYSDNYVNNLKRKHHSERDHMKQVADQYGVPIEVFGTSPSSTDPSQPFQIAGSGPGQTSGRHRGPRRGKRPRPDISMAATGPSSPTSSGAPRPDSEANQVVTGRSLHLYLTTRRLPRTSPLPFRHTRTNILMQTFWTGTRLWTNPICRRRQCPHRCH